MSNQIGSTEALAALISLKALGTALMAGGMLVLAVLVIIYSFKKADGAARLGCFTMASFLIGSATLQCAQFLLNLIGAEYLCAELKVFAGILLTIIVVANILVYPHAPDLKAVRRLQTRNAERELLYNQLSAEYSDTRENLLLRQQFIAGIGHEVRSQLSSVLGMHELLLNSSLNAEQRQLAVAANESAHMLLSTLSDLQDVGQIEAGAAHLELAPFTINKLVYEACSTCAESARRKKLFTNTEIDPVVPASLLGDSRRIVQALRHLIACSISHTDKGGITVRVTLQSMVSPSVARLQFSVKDTGIGLSEDELLLLARPFPKLQLQARRYPELGIGLYISRRLVEMMGSEIQAEVLKGQGTLFSFALDLPSCEGAPQEVVLGELSATSANY